MRPGELIDAAWAALIAGRPRELHALETLLEKPLMEGLLEDRERVSLLRLHLLFEATARNLRILHGQARMD